MTQLDLRPEPDRTVYRGVLRRWGSRALAWLGDLAANEVVPGTTDNDADSWRIHHRDGIASAQEGVAHALARLAAFGDAIDPNGFSAVTSAQAAAGYAFAVVENAPAATAYIAGNETQTISSNPSGALSVSVRTPRGVDARAVVIDHRRGENLVATYPRSSDDWDFLTQPDGSPHYSYWKLVDGSVGSTIGISGVQAGDTFDMRVHDASAFEDFIVDQLPDVAGREDGNLVVLRQQDGTQLPGLYELEIHLNDYYEGEVYFPTTFGQHDAQTVRISVNPENTLTWFTWTREGNGPAMHVFLRRSWFTGTPPTNLYLEATHYNADGAAIADNNAIAGSSNTRVHLTRASSEDGDLTDIYAYQAIPSAAVIGLWRGFTDGGRLRFKLYTDSGYSTTLVDATTGHWNRLSFSEEEGLALQHAVAALAERINTPDTRLADQIAALQDRTRYIEFTPDTDPVWALIDGNRDGSKGGIAFIGDLGMNAGNTFFDGIQYDGSQRIASDALGFYRSVTTPASDLDYNNIAILWVLPNDAVWDHLRVRGLRSSGTEVFKIRAQDLRNVPESAKSALNLRNIPDDYTVRWTAHPNNELYGLGDAGPGATFVMEQLPGDGHIPIWTGELRDRATDEIKALQTKTRDIISAHGDSPTWEDATADSEGGLWASTTESVTEQQLSAATWRTSVSGVNVNTGIIRARIPAAADPRQARLVLHEGHDNVELISGLAFLGVIGNWRYYEYTGTLRHGDAKLQIDAAHAVGTSIWGGRLQEHAVTLGNLAEDVPRSIADTHRFPAWLDEVANLNTGETFANRGWLIPNANRWNVNGSVSIEDNGGAMDWLRIDAAAVLGPAGKGAQGIRVILRRGTPEVIIGSVFIPWSTFRSVDGNYVHNADRGHAQGVACGMWDPSQRNSMIFGDCRYTDGRFLITFTSANAGQSATAMTIYTAG